MKKITLLLATLLLLSGCGLISSVKDVTDNAAQVLNDVDELLREVDSRVESGELSQEVADLIDERVENLAEVLNEAIEQNGGFLFEQVDGSVDNVFNNISDLLDQIKQGILDESAPALISQLSSELQMQINVLSSNLEDVVTLTFGNTFILVDKVTNSAITIGSLIFLVVGLLLFSILLFVRKRKVKGVGVVGLILMLLYIVFFLAVLLVPYVRGLIVKGLDFGKEIEAIELKPVITGIVPQTFVLGKNDRIILYGKHLGKMNTDSANITLRQGNQVKVTIPKKHLIVINDFKIVLGNFKSGDLNWRPLRFEELNMKLAERNASINTALLAKYAYKVNDIIYPRVVKAAPSTTIGNNVIINNVPTVFDNNAGRNIEVISKVTKRPTYEVMVKDLRLAQTSIPPNVSEILKGIFEQQFKLPEGDYGVHVSNGSQEVGSPQFLSILNPPPPAPKPDLYPVDLYFSGGTAVAGEKTGLTLKLGIAYPEEVSKTFKVKLTASPSIGTKTITVSEGKIAAASASNLTTVTFENLILNSAGDYTFQVFVDDQNRISESNESNNSFSKKLRVKKFVYDATVKFETFISNEDMDMWGDDEYRIDISTSATGKSVWKIDYDKDGSSGKNYN
ncbi:MAG: hypothetical protein D6816_06400, partial [Bacteroidetes bacterium]